jgi:hypothetical protein
VGNYYPTRVSCNARSLKWCRTFELRMPVRALLPHCTIASLAKCCVSTATIATALSLEYSGGDCLRVHRHQPHSATVRSSITVTVSLLRWHSSHWWHWRHSQPRSYSVQSHGTPQWTVGTELRGRQCELLWRPPTPRASGSPRRYRLVSSPGAFAPVGQSQGTGWGCIRTQPVLPAGGPEPGHRLGLYTYAARPSRLQASQLPFEFHIFLAAQTAASTVPVVNTPDAEPAGKAVASRGCSPEAKERDPSLLYVCGTAVTIFEIGRDERLI